jgi:hypothetical protein
MPTALKSLSVFMGYYSWLTIFALSFPLLKRYTTKMLPGQPNNDIADKGQHSTEDKAGYQGKIELETSSVYKYVTGKPP